MYAVCGGNGEAGRLDWTVGIQARSGRMLGAWRCFEQVAYFGSLLITSVAIKTEKLHQ